MVGIGGRGGTVGGLMPADADVGCVVAVGHGELGNDGLVEKRGHAAVLVVVIVVVVNDDLLVQLHEGRLVPLR